MTEKPNRQFQGRSVASLSAEELQTLASRAFSEAARRAAADGFAVPGYVEGKVVSGLEDEKYLQGLQKRATKAEPSGEERVGSGRKQSRRTNARGTYADLDRVRDESALKRLGIRGLRKATVKYRNKDNPLQTWTGRGRQPRWLAAALKKGASLKDFAT